MGVIHPSPTLGVATGGFSRGGWGLRVSVGLLSGEALPLRHSTLRFSTAALLLLSLLVSCLSSQAQDATSWSSAVSIPTGGNAVTFVAGDGSDSSVLVLGQIAGPKVIASYFDGTSWALMSSDVTGDITHTLGDVIALDGGVWGALLGTTGGSLQLWISEDNGATWANTHTVGAFTGSIYQSGIATDGTRIAVAWKDGSAGKFASTLGSPWTTWTSTETISDNKGAPGVAGTAALTAFDSIVPVVGGGGYDVWMTESGPTFGAVYHVESTDGSFWTVPFSTTGAFPPVDGSTMRMVAFNVPAGSGNCPGTWPGSNAVFLNAKGDSVMFRRVGSGALAGLSYFCRASSINLSGQSATLTAMPGSGSTTYANNNRPQADDNSAGDITAYVDDTAGVGRLFANGVLVHTTGNLGPNAVHAVAVTGTQAFFVYVDASIGGQLREIHADWFTTTAISVAVNDLVGYSMDNTGVTILARTDSGDTIESYGVLDLDQTSTVATADCSADGPHFDGVNAANFNSGTVDTIYLTYVDCSPDGDSDAFRIREGDLLTSPTYGCNEATPNVEHSGLIVIPENLGEIGTISDLNPSYAGRCSDEGLDDAAIGFSFSTVGTLAEGGGKIGTVALVYNEGVVADDTDTDLETISSVAFPEVNQFCSWTNRDTGNDYMAGVGNGPTKAFEIVSSIVQNPDGLGLEADVELNGQFSNSGQYGNAVGVACQGDNLVILKVDQVHFLGNISTSSEDVMPGWPKTINGATRERGVAITGSGRFIAYVDGCMVTDTFCESGEILIYASNGTLTGSLTVPSGTWRGMEFDNSGEHLAVFTNDFITVYGTAEVTCVLTNSCAIDGGIGDGDLPPSTPGGDGDCAAIFCPPADGIGGISSSALLLFLGIVIVASFAASMSEKTASGAAGVALFALLGLFIAYALGFIPLWVVVALTIMGVATIFLGIINGRNAGGV